MVNDVRSEERSSGSSLPGEPMPSGRAGSSGVSEDGANRPRRRFVWLGLGAVLGLFAVHTDLTVPAAAWLYAIFLLRFAQLSRPLSGSLWLWAATVAATIWWLVQTKLLFVPSVVGVFLALATLLTLPFVLHQWLATRLERSTALGAWAGLAATLVFPTARVAAEYAFAAASGFGGYGSLATTQVENLPLLQIASVTGSSGVSFLVAWFAAVVAWAWGQRWTWQRIRRPVVLFTTVLAASLILGGARLAAMAAVGPAEQDRVRVATLSPSVAAQERWDTAFEAEVDGGASAAAVTRRPSARMRVAAGEVERNLLNRTRREARAGASVVVWSEGALSIPIEARAGLLDRARAIARAERVHIVVAATVSTGVEAVVRPRNEAVLVTPAGRVGWRFEKNHPTPMERAQGMRSGTGDVPVASTSKGRWAGVICYDVDFAGLMRQAAGEGTDLMLVPANDWPGFGKVHAEMAVVRAVENGYPIVRSGAGGESTAIDPLGRVLARANHYRDAEPGVVAEVPGHRVTTAYAVVGDAFAWICVLVLGGLVLLGWRAGRPTGRRDGGKEPFGPSSTAR